MRTLFSIAGLAIMASAMAQPAPEVIDRIVDNGVNHNDVMKTLKGLTNIGPRLTGSPQLARAQQYAMAQFKRYGLSNVHLEDWGNIPVGFYRGNTQVGKMVEPFEFPIQYTTMNWMPGTSGPVQAKAVKAPATLEELNASPAKFKGAWIIMPRATTMRGPVLANDDLTQALDKVGIAGRIFGAADERVHSSGSWRDKTFDVHPTQVNIVVRKSDYDRVVRNIDFGRDTQLLFNIQNRWVKGPLTQYNVVADIPGTEKPDEFIIVCGHLDSWNSPGSQGACDNGTGSSVALEAARLLMKSGAKPKRTIRFILWSGEEQGLLGSRGYVDKRKTTGEIDRIKAVLNDDGGTNYQGGYQCLASQKPILDAAIAPTQRAFPDMPMENTLITATPRGGSSDHAPFAWLGVPAYFTIEKGRADYGFVWHTQNDRYEYAIPEYLRQSSTNHAVVAYTLATIPETLPRFEPIAQANALSDHERALLMELLRPVGADTIYFSDEEAEHDHTDGHDHADDYVKEFIDRTRRIGRSILQSL